MEFLLYLSASVWTAVLVLWQLVMGGMAVVIVVPMVVFTIEDVATRWAAGDKAHEPAAPEPHAEQPRRAA